MGTCRHFLFLLGLLASFSAVRGENTAEFVVGDFVFTAPRSWQMQEPSSLMRKAQFRVSDDKTGAVAELVFFNFGEGQGGSVVDNIARWRGQLADLKSEKVEEKEIAGTKVTMVKFEGTYQSGMPGGPRLAQAGSMLLGAILESPRGNVFVRLTGPSGWVEKIETNFAALIEAGAKNKRG